jgi:peptidoglycan/xylan/chitin deacetylase (PgdA/CDA1 family)
VKPAFSLAEKTGAAAIAAAAVLSAAAPATTASVLPLAAFVVACIAAPFFPRSGFFFPVISAGPPERPAVALTFDDGPDPVTTPALLDLLDRHRVKATFFVVGNRVDRYPALAGELLLRGHAIGCHSHRHDVFMGLKSSSTVKRDMNRAMGALARIGVRPLAFRPPVGILTPRIGAALQYADMYAVTFSRRGWDAGNRRTEGLSDRILDRLRAGDVILLHDAAPGRSFSVKRWLAEVERIITGINRRNLSIVSLESLIGRPVMKPLAEDELP